MRFKLISRVTRLGLAAPVSLMLSSTALGTETISMLLQDSPLAGSQFHELKICLPEIQVGDALELVAEPDNPHDVYAVQVRWRGHLLGYVPRQENHTLAKALADREAVRAEVTAIRPHRNPWLRLRFAVFLPL